MQTSSSGVTPAYTRPRHSGPPARLSRLSPLPTLAAALFLVIATCAACTGSDTVAPTIEIRLEAPRESTDRAGGASIEVGGLTREDLDALRASELTDTEWVGLLRVTVVQEDREDGIGGLEMPAVLGTYAVGDDGLLRFSPMFPFDPGRPYSVRFDPSQLPGRDGALASTEPTVEVVALPRPDVSPTTVVDRVFPSGDQMPENQLKLYIHFSAPMSDVDGLEYVSLRDARGVAVEEPFLPLGTEFWDLDHLRYTVFFDPGRIKQGIELNERLGRSLQEGETYVLTVDAAWPDAEGNPLQTPFEKRFTVGPADMTPLDTATWRLRVPAGGSMQRLVVSFPEPLDNALMRRAISIEDEAGRRVEGDVEIGNWETRWTLTPSQPWVTGAYSLVALSVVEDLAGNKIGRPFEIDVFERVDDTIPRDEVRIPFDIR
jgi:hypothetical protein